MTTRIYRVADGDVVRLVEAINPAQAIRHCASQRYRIGVAKATDVAYLIGKGVQVEQAKPEQGELA